MSKSSPEDFIRQVELQLSLKFRFQNRHKTGKCFSISKFKLLDFTTYLLKVTFVYYTIAYICYQFFRFVESESVLDKCYSLYSCDEDVICW